MSELRNALEEYLAVRRALGFQIKDLGSALTDFVLFSEREGASFITTELALRWATQPTDAHPARWANRLAMVRRLARYHSASDPRTEIPPNGILPHHLRRQVPYIYKDAEIAQLVEAAKHLSSPRGLRSSTYETLYGLLAVTGMRISEPLALDREDVDLAAGILTLRRTKFGKARYVPIHPSSVRALRRYARRRDRVFQKLLTPAFFVSERGTRLKVGAARWTFAKLSCQTGLRGPKDRRGPRVHDLRHSFAVHTLVRWYRAGVDVERRLSRLATYLGHGGVAGTYWYLTATPELLRWAARRLEGRREEASS